MGGMPEEFDYEENSVETTETCSMNSNSCGSTDNVEASGDVVSSEVSCANGNSCLTKMDGYKETAGDVPYSYLLSQGTIDRRVSLTVHPKVTSSEISLYAERIAYVLGGDLKDGKAYFPNTTNGKPDKEKPFYAFLRKCLGNTSGLIFPYTPSLKFNHKVNYQQTDILHSNLAFQSYKNTPPPSIGLSAVFTADNRKNAIDMLSAIWFLTAMTKCEFGQYNEACKDESRKVLGGLPPPVLYLNGYNNLIDNIPVVISALEYQYPDDKNYVNVVMNLTQKDNNYQVEYNINKTDYTSSIGKDIGIPEPVTVLGNRASDNNSAILSVWLPTELKIGLSLLVQPNLLKTQKQWALDDYKTAALMLNPRKNYTQSSGSVTYNVNGNNETIDMIFGSFIPSGWTW